MGPSLSSALQPGQTFGRYQIVRTLGVGSFGIVYEAVQYPLGRSVALKLLHDRTLSHPDAQARFEREAMAAARMRHPHIVEVFDFGAHEGTAFLAMELLEGESLQALIRRSGALPQSLAVDLLLPIISAVAAVHDQGIIHRDLKPENILLTVTPEREWHPKLLDFGIAKLEHAGPELTRTNALLGTPCYMSPEQVMQARSIDGRADQWSMGVMFYEAVTGAKPFFSETLLVIMTAITSEDPVPPRVHRPELDAGFEAVILRALQRRPEDRFASMRDFGSALLPYASEAAQARWYSDFNEVPQSAPRISGPNLRAPRFSAPPSPAVPSFAVEEEATRARQDAAPVDEPTELVNTTSQDGEFPAGFLPPPVQPIRASVTSSQSQPGVKVSQSLMQQMPQGVQPRPVAHTPAPSQRPVSNTPPPSQSQDLFAQENSHEVGTGTLAMDLDTAPGRLSPVQGPGAPRPATAKMPSFEATGRDGLSRGPGDRARGQRAHRPRDAAEPVRPAVRTALSAAAALSDARRVARRVPRRDLQLHVRRGRASRSAEELARGPLHRPRCAGDGRRRARGRLLVHHAAQGRRAEPPRGDASDAHARRRRGRSSDAPCRGRCVGGTARG